MSNAVSETITQEGSLLLVSLIFGAFLMCVYDLVRIIRTIVPHKTFLFAVEDMLYWMLCSFSVFAMIYQENDGLLRWFVVAGIALGMIIWNRFLSPVFVGIFSKILKKVIHILHKILGVFGKPIGVLVKRCKKRLKKIGKAIKIGLSKK